MFLSVFDIFKIGIGPSSSHTVGPMVAARRFVEEVLRPLAGNARRLTVTLHGSLAFTGKGHGTDRAIALALAGEAPDTVDPDRVASILEGLAEAKTLAAIGLAGVAFDPATDIRFDYGPPLPGHANGMVFRALDAAGATLAESDVLFGRRRLRCARRRTRGGRRRGHRRCRGGKSDRSLSLCERDRDARDGEGFRPLGRRPEARQRASRAPGEDLDASLDRIWAAMESCMNARASATAARFPAASM